MEFPNCCAMLSQAPKGGIAQHLYRDSTRSAGFKQIRAIVTHRTRSVGTVVQAIRAEADRGHEATV